MRLGMPIEEVFDHFTMPDSYAQKFIKDPSLSNLITLGATERESVFPDGESVYSLREHSQISLENRVFNINWSIQFGDMGENDFSVMFYCNEGERNELISISWIKKWQGSGYYTIFV